MICEKLHARDLGLPEGSPDITLTTYVRPAVSREEAPRWGVLVIPGGGYRRHADREMEPIALAFLGAGIQAFLLEYSVVPHHWPQAFLETSAAIAYLRANAERFQFAPDRLAICGFSAGGHLAGCLANFWQDPIIKERLGLEPEQVRPDAVILGYPVICADTPSVRRLTDAETLPPGLERLSLETSVTENNPPTFLWTTCTDAVVPPDNTLRYALALNACHVPYELHVFMEGPHGMGTVIHSAVAPEAVRIRAAEWHSLCVSWLNRLDAQGGEAQPVPQPIPQPIPQPVPQP